MTLIQADSFINRAKNLDVYNSKPSTRHYELYMKKLMPTKTKARPKEGFSSSVPLESEEAALAEAPELLVAVMEGAPGSDVEGDASTRITVARTDSGK